MSISEVLTKYHNIETDLLLAHVLRKPKEFLFMHGERRLTRIQANRLARMVKRREKGEPIAYILEYKDFMGLRFKVNKDVLIPRPETEGLVEKVISGQWIVDSKKKIRILDVGTGSGCIAVSLAKLLPATIHNSRFIIYASDISKKALKVAKANARRHKVKIQFIHSHILENIRMNFDVIVANLPYVPSTDYRILMKDLKYEPKASIFAKEKGLYLIRRLLYQISQLKQIPKYVFLEFDPRQKQPLSKLIKKLLPKAKQKFYKDYSSKWRVVEIKNNSTVTGLS